MEAAVLEAATAAGSVTANGAAIIADVISASAGVVRLPSAPNSSSDQDHDGDTGSVKSEDPTSASTTTTKRRRGHRQQSEVWKILTTEENPHRATASICMHCETSVPHHHKSEKARAHLQRCVLYRRKMLAVDPSLRPEWLDLDTDGKRRRRSAAASTMTPSNGLPSTFGHTIHNATSGSDVGLHGDGGFRGEVHDTVLRTHASIGSSEHIPDAQAVLDALAMHFYVTATPLAHMEELHLRRALTLCLPHAVTSIPTKADLAGPLLDRAYDRVRTDVQMAMESTKQHCVIHANTWYPTCSDVALYAAGIGQSEALYLESVNMDNKAKSDPDTLALHMARIVGRCNKNIIGAVTDNSPANQAMWAKVRQDYPSLFFHGCASHGLYQFVSQICAPPADAQHVGFPVEYPFYALHLLTTNCRELVEFFHEADFQRHTEFAHYRPSPELQGLQFPLQGQWSGLKAGFESVLAAIPVLKTIVSPSTFSFTEHEPERERRDNIRDTVCDSNLSKNLAKAIAILSPLDSMLTRLEQEEDLPCSEVFYWFAKELPETLRAVPCLSESESIYLTHLNQTRFNAMYGDSHGIAYILDPRYIGDGLTMDVRKSIEDQIFEFPADDNLTENSDEYKFDIAQQLTQYVIDASREKTNNTFRYVMLVKNKKTVLQYWLTDGAQWPLLQRLALRVFSLPSSTLPAIRKVRGAMQSHPDGPELPLEAMDKIHYVQINSKFLQAARDRETDPTCVDL